MPTLVELGLVLTLLGTQFDMGYVVIVLVALARPQGLVSLFGWRRKQNVPAA